MTEGLCEWMEFAGSVGEAQADQLAHGFYCHACVKEVDVHMDEHGEEYECCDCGGACVEAPDQSLDDFIEVAPSSSAPGAAPNSHFAAFSTQRSRYQHS